MLPRLVLVRTRQFFLLLLFMFIKQTWNNLWSNQINLKIMGSLTLNMSALNFYFRMLAKYWWASNLGLLHFLLGIVHKSFPRPKCIYFFLLGTKNIVVWTPYRISIEPSNSLCCPTDTSKSGNISKVCSQPDGDLAFKVERFLKQINRYILSGPGGSYKNSFISKFHFII